MADVFISYKSQRRFAAAHLARILELHGYSVWFDYRLAAGGNFGRQIERELRAAKVVIVLWCSLSIGSDWVLEEANFGKKRKCLVPAFLESVELPLGFSLAETVDLMKWDGAPTSYFLRQRLIPEVERLVGRPPNRNTQELETYEDYWRHFGAMRPLQFIQAEEVAEQSGSTLKLNKLNKLMDAGNVWRDEIDGLPTDRAPQMVTLPLGQYLMGSPRGQGQANEWPQHEVRIDHTVAIGKYPVTFDEWDAARAAGAPLRALDDGGWGRGLRPAIHLQWSEAKAYIDWLNMKLGLVGRTDAYRLPSEAEWEYACRAGAQTTYATGETIEERDANFSKESFQSAKKTVPVGQYSANAFGVCDMHGNVWEWCEDVWNDSYDGAPHDGSAWISGDTSRRVQRGGAWTSIAEQLRAAFRYPKPPTFSHSNAGFRLARTVAAVSVSAA